MAPIRGEPLDAEDEELELIDDEIEANLQRPEPMVATNRVKELKEKAKAAQEAREAQEVRSRGRPRLPENMSVAKPVKQETTKEMRFKVFAQPERMGIVDTESNEVVAEGTNVWAALAEILNRLEAIEVKIGSV